MSTTSKLTVNQMRAGYKFMVERSLMLFFHQNQANAESIVSAWWHRIAARRRAFRTALFMHDEAIYTAADLANSEGIEIEDPDLLLNREENRQRYETLRDQAYEFAISAPRLMAPMPALKLAPGKKRSQNATTLPKQRIVA